MLVEEKEQKPINTNAITRHNVIISVISSCGDVVSASFKHVDKFLIRVNDVAI